MDSVAGKLKSLQVTVQRAAKSIPATPNFKSQPKSPTVEELDEYKGLACGRNEGKAAAAVPIGRRVKAYWKKNTTAKEEAVPRSSPKRQLDDEDGLKQTLVKRAKLTPAGNQVEKRKSDVSMVDAKPESGSSPSPQGKQWRREEVPEETVSAVQVEYEDITAEVDTRMQQRQERKEHERKQELGIIDKRKRQSDDSFNIELDGGKNAEKRSCKRKKNMHSEQASEG